MSQFADQISYSSLEDCFAVLTETERKLLDDHSSLLMFQKGETLIKQGMVASHVIYIEEGLARLDVLTEGDQVTLMLLPAGNFVGIVCCFAERNFNFSSVALLDTRVRLMDLNVFKQLIKQNGDFALLMVRHMSLMTSKMVYSMARYSQKHIDGALAVLLLEFVKIFRSNKFMLPMKRNEISQTIGYSKESVINAFSRLNKEKIIKVKEKQVEILKIELLREIAEKG